MPETPQSIPDIQLRASVSNHCNFDCSYCPKGDWVSGGMENYTPDIYVDRILSAEEYTIALRLIRDGLDVHRITLTGGEPMLNPQLCYLLKDAKATFNQVEITTNCSLLSESLIRSLETFDLDLVKVSLDTVVPNEFAAVTGTKSNRVCEKVMAGICRLCEGPLRVALNTVVMKRNLAGLRDLINFARQARCAIHLLDYVYYPSKRRDWEAQYVPMDILAEVFTNAFGPPQRIPRYGCTFYEFDADGVPISFKDSAIATVRSKACDRCDEYCQEGPYCLKLSVHGWVTACPSIDPEKGVLLLPELGKERASTRLESLLPMFTETRVDTTSFQRFLKMWGLHPEVSRDEVGSLFNTSGVCQEDGTK